MTSHLRTALVAATFCTAISSQAAVAIKARTKADIEAATRLQIFLDRAEFAPGKIDGHYGEFTLKALALYREAHGGSPAPTAAPAPAQPARKTKQAEEVAPDVTGLDVAGISPVFLSYTVTEDDLKSIGEVPSSVSAQAKKKSLPYKNATEGIAEKFHTDVTFLAVLNPGKTEAIKAGDTLCVPNVEPFELPEVKDMQPGSEIPAQAVNDLDEEPDAKKAKADAAPKEQSSEPTAPTTAVKVDMKTSMLAVYESEKLIAAYPVTIGSAQTKSPVGDWTVRGVAKMPNFRYDKAMLNHGVRSGNFHVLPPGPNNPVGVIWIALNKKGIGMHGTNDPDSIGRSASHGCMRLANWDVVRLAAKVKAGVPVSIH
jgi:lipoprotein-anchoring transpeptidase ErfK/SrfK